MPRFSRLFTVLLFQAVFVTPALAQQGAGPLAALLSRGANPDGPFARRGLNPTTASTPGATKTIAPVSLSDSLVLRAREQLGRRYRFAAASPERGFDCSGLVKYILGAFGVDLPHNAARIAKVGDPVPADSGTLKVGDLLMFGRGRSTRISHVGIYVGDGKMIHASTSQRRVVETKVPSQASSLKLRSIRRVLRDSTTARSGSE
jgi:cell wall-associated NlpC family hydrolase